MSSYGISFAMHTAPTTREPFRYRRHEPEKTLLYQTLAREWETWHAERQADTSRSPLPEYMAREMDAYLRCGILDHGFLILSCAGCEEKIPVAFSCKRRGFCPSCCAKRMSEISVHLIDNVLPHTAYRQWVTTFPYPLRYGMAASRKLTNALHREISRMIEIYYLDKAEERGIKKPVAGGVTFIQRFGSALNLNVHMHSVALEGVFSVAGTEPRFYQLPGPSDEEVCHIVEATANATLKMLKAKGFVGESEDDYLDPSCLDEVFQASEQLAAAVSASTSMRVAFGQRQGQAVRRIGRFEDFAVESAELIGRRCARRSHRETGGKGGGRAARRSCRAAGAASGPGVESQRSRGGDARAGSDHLYGQGRVREEVEAGAGSVGAQTSGRTARRSSGRRLAGFARASRPFAARQALRCEKEQGTRRAFYRQEVAARHARRPPGTCTAAT
jgi:hypothetical protein